MSETFTTGIMEQLDIFDGVIRNLAPSQKKLLRQSYSDYITPY